VGIQFNYLPKKQQKKQLKHLKELIELCGNNDIKVSIYGGYGLDGLLGELTRDHHDIDLLVNEPDREKLKKVLVSLGYYFERENNSKEVFKTKALGGEFQIEINKQNRLNEFTSIGEEEIFPKVDNANFHDFTFKTPTLKGHEHIHKMQSKRAKERGWISGFRHKDHAKKIVNILKNQSY
jgi:hypothetical protein